MDLAQHASWYRYHPTPFLEWESKIVIIIQNLTSNFQQGRWCLFIFSYSITEYKLCFFSSSYSVLHDQNINESKYLRVDMDRHGIWVYVLSVTAIWND